MPCFANLNYLIIAFESWRLVFVWLVLVWVCLCLESFEKCTRWCLEGATSERCKCVLVRFLLALVGRSLSLDRLLVVVASAVASLSLSFLLGTGLVTVLLHLNSFRVKVQNVMSI
jgi:hypothetical protein